MAYSANGKCRKDKKLNRSKAVVKICKIDHSCNGNGICVRNEFTGVKSCTCPIDRTGERCELLLSTTVVKESVEPTAACEHFYALLP